MRLSFLLSLIALTILVDHLSTVRAQSDFFEASCTVSEKKMCVNLGGANDTIGEYRGDASLVTYMHLGGVPRLVSTNNCRIGNTVSPLAFVKQMSHRRAVSFFVGVELGYEYDIEVGFAHISSCKGGGSELKVSSQGMDSSKFNVLKEVGCRNSYFVTLQKVIPGPWKLSNKGKITVVVTNEGRTGTVSVATLCLTQKPLTGPQRCSQSECVTLSGNYGYTSAHGLGCKHSDGFGVLKIPNGARVVKALIRWSTLLDKSSSNSSITLNNEKLYPDTFIRDGFFIVASKDITKSVSNFGGNKPYIISKFDSERCEDAVWNLVAIYEHDDLPAANINLCTPLRSQKSFSFQFGCIQPLSTKTATLNMYFLQAAKGFRDEELFLNDELVATDFLDNNIGLGADYVSLNASAEFKKSTYFFNVTKTGGYGNEIMPIIDLIEVA